MALLTSRLCLPTSAVNTINFFQAAFILLLKELRVKFDEHGLLLSAAVASAESSASLSYNILEVGK